MSLAANPSSLPLGAVSKFAQSVVSRVKKSVSYAFRLMRVVAKRADKKLHKNWRRFVDGLQQYQGRPEMHGLLLGAFAMAAAFLLGSANLSTQGAIAERAAEDLRYSLSQVVPAEVHDNNLATDTAKLTDAKEGSVSFHRARMGNKVEAVAFEIIGQGYGGSIQVLLGIDTTGKLLGVRVLSHSETPGLGDRIEQQKSDWILGFDGLSLGNPPVAMWKVKKDGGRFDQFSGATITPRAVVAAIRRGLELFQRDRDQFLDIAQKPAKTKETG